MGNYVNNNDAKIQILLYIIQINKRQLFKTLKRQYFRTSFCKCFLAETKTHSNEMA